METKEKTRKTYEKPQVNRVKLIIEEAVLQACKASDTDPARTNKVCNHPKCASSYGT